MIHRKELDTHRGVSHVGARGGFAQVHVALDRSDISRARLDFLQEIADAGISLRFVKLTPAGISFLIDQSDETSVRELLGALGFEFEMLGHRSLVITYAPNMRDEPGLIAKIIRTTIESGVEVGQVGDMHDRVLLMVASDEADKLRLLLESRLIEVGP